MPYTSNYVTSGDQRTSTTTVPQITSQGGSSSGDDWLKKLQARQEEMWAREDLERRIAQTTPRGRGTNAMSGRTSVADSGHNQSPQEKELDALSMLAKRKQLEAMMSPAPMRMTTFASGAVNGYVPDTNAFTGIQKKIFAPNNAGMLADGLSDGQIQGMSPAGAANSWEAKTAQNPNSVENQSGPSQYELMRVIQQLQAQLSGGR
jgi:hypothetical protein